MKHFLLSCSNNWNTSKNHRTKITLDVTSIPVMKLPALFSYLLLVSWNKAKQQWKLNEHWQWHNHCAKTNLAYEKSILFPLILTPSYISLQRQVHKHLTSTDSSELKHIKWTQIPLLWGICAFAIFNCCINCLIAKAFTLSQQYSRSQTPFLTTIFTIFGVRFFM